MEGCVERDADGCVVGCVELVTWRVMWLWTWRVGLLVMWRVMWIAMWRVEVCRVT